MVRKAFTIIELLIVMAVITIIVGILLPRIRGMQDQANITKSQAELRTLQTAIESYAITHQGSLPGTDTWTSDLATANPRIVASVPNDPFRSPAGPYTYAVSGRYYVIYSVGPNNDAAYVINNDVLTVTGDPAIYATNCNTITTSGSSSGGVTPSADQ